MAAVRFRLAHTRIARIRKAHSATQRGENPLLPVHPRQFSNIFKGVHELSLTFKNSAQIQLIASTSASVATQCTSSRAVATTAPAGTSSRTQETRRRDGLRGILGLLGSSRFIVVCYYKSLVTVVRSDEESAAYERLGSQST